MVHCVFGCFPGVRQPANQPAGGGGVPKPPSHPAVARRSSYNFQFKRKKVREMRCSWIGNDNCISIFFSPNRLGYYNTVCFNGGSLYHGSETRQDKAHAKELKTIEKRPLHYERLSCTMQLVGVSRDL